MEMTLDDFKAAEEARNKKDYGLDSNGIAFNFDTKLKNLKDMYYGRREPKSLPWKNCSNRSMKIAMAIVEMLHARMFPAAWNEDLVRWKPVEKTDKDKVKRINDLMVWWIRVKVKLAEFYDKWVKMALGLGEVFTEVSWEIKYSDTGEFTETPIVDEFGIQLYNPDGTPAINKDKKLKIDETTRIDIISKENVYFQEGQTNIQEDPVIIKCRWLYYELEAMERQNKTVNVSEPLHENGTYLKDKLMAKINETYSFSNQTNIDIIKAAKLRSTPVEVLKVYRKIDIDDDGIEEDIRILIEPLNRIYLGGVAVKDLSKRVIRPIDFTKVNNLLENPDALEGYGFLEMVLPLAEEIDAIFNQITDANTFSILRPGFYDPAGNLQPQNITLAPNKLIPVPDPQRNIYFPNIDIPTERLMLAMKGVLEFIERLTGASSYVMGKESEIVGGSGTATRTQAIVGASEQRFAMPAIRLRRGAARILTLILDQIQKNIPSGLENRILGENGEPIFNGNELTAEGISAELDAYLLDDVSMGSVNIERQLANFLYATLLTNPIIYSDPSKLYAETANLLKAYGQDPVEHLGPAPEMKDTDTPEEENTLLVQGDFTKVKALLTENHIQHIVKHREFLMSPTLLTLSPGQQQSVIGMTQAHIQEHITMMQQLMSIMQKARTGGNNQGTAQPSGMGNIPEPFGQVEATKETGAVQPTPPM